MGGGGLEAPFLISTIDSVTLDTLQWELPPEEAKIMLGIGQLVTTHDAQSAQLFLDDFTMQAERRADSTQRHDEFMRRVWVGIVRFFRRLA